MGSSENDDETDASIHEDELEEKTFDDDCAKLSKNEDEDAINSEAEETLFGKIRTSSLEEEGSREFDEKISAGKMLSISL